MAETKRITTYILRVDGTDIELTATNLEGARGEAIERLPEGYDAGERTYWVRGQLIAIEDGEEEIVDRLRVAVEPIEPSCDWRGHGEGAEIEGAGEDSEESHLYRQESVWGKGGGVIVAEVCLLCGLRRYTDTWAQDMTDGTQGHRSTRYESGDVPTTRVHVDAAADHDAEALNAAMRTYDADESAYAERDDGSRTWTLVVARGASRALIEALEAIKGVDAEVVRD